MSEAVKKALEAAAMQPCADTNDRCLCREKGALDRDMCGGYLPDAAAIIAAFFENLGPAALDSVPDVGFMDATACRNAWLKMVKEARDA